MQNGNLRERARAGIALVPAILIVAGLAIFMVALMTAVMSGSRTVVHQNEDYQVASSVESVAMLAAERLWSQYVAEQGGAAGDIESFRLFLSGQGIDDAGAGGLPGPRAGKDLVPVLALPEEHGRPRFNDVNVDAVNVVRRDVDDATQLFLTISASTTRGEGLVDPLLNRAVQQVYTVEPADFPGFEYALLANNVNCVFCHARIDSAERWWNAAPDLRGTFERVKVGTLESLMVRHDANGSSGPIDDSDADSFIAGSLYVRGLATESDGGWITDWNAQSFLSHPFDAEGNILETAGLGLAPFSPAGDPPDALENLYLAYADDYAAQVDGYLPDHFPPPFPDDGGLDPATGLPDYSGAGNKRVDDVEFLEVAAATSGAIVAGIVNVTAPGAVIDSALDYADAVFTGNQDGLVCNGTGIAGNVVLTGWPDNPIWIDGTLAIDGDLVIQGYVKGEGSIYVRGNVYVPSDLIYADGTTADGARIFGIDADGNKNALALTAGGNVLIGDFQRPATLQPDGSIDVPGALEIIDGSSTGAWNFSLAEMALFNRGEWAKTQAKLPDSTGTLVDNPGYVAGYVPRYYGYGEGTAIPIFNQGIAFDASTLTWIGPETPTYWDPSLLTLADPTNPADPLLYDADGTPRAVTSSIAHTDGWMLPNVYKLSVEYFEGLHQRNTPLNVDGLLYTNNAIFSIVYRDSAYAGMLLMNGSIVAADVGMLVPGKKDALGKFPNHSPLSKYAIGLQLNYDPRLKKALNVKNPFQVQLKRTYWNPTANLL